MVDRMRALLESPHDPAVARAVVLLACWVTIGLAVLIGLGGAGGGDQASRPPLRPHAAAATPTRPNLSRAESASEHRSGPKQDPQDRRGSSARRRAERELASHRALQHVPYRLDGVAIDLVGARDGRAVLRVRGRSIAAARRGWHAFLRRFADPGAAYLPIFRRSHDA